MPTRFERWMRSKLSAITARTPSRLVPLAAQSRELPVPYSLPAMTTSGRVVRLVEHGGVVDRHRLAGRRVAGDAALDLPSIWLRMRMLAKVPRIITS